MDEKVRKVVKKAYTYEELMALNKEEFAKLGTKDRTLTRLEEQLFECKDLGVAQFKENAFWPPAPETMYAFSKLKNGWRKV